MSRYIHAQNHDFAGLHLATRRYGERPNVLTLDLLDAFDGLAVIRTVGQTTQQAIVLDVAQLEALKAGIGTMIAQLEAAARV